MNKSYLAFFGGIFLLSSCDIASLNGESSEKKNAASDPEYSIEETADFVMTRLIGDETREGRGERALVLANKLYEKQAPDSASSSQSSTGGDSAGEGTKSSGDEEGEVKQSEPGCGFVVSEDGTAVKTCNEETSTDSDSHDAVIGQCLEIINEDSDKPVQKERMGLGLKDPIHSEEAPPKVIDCYEYIPISYDYGYCGYSPSQAGGDGDSETASPSFADEPVRIEASQPGTASIEPNSEENESPGSEEIVIEPIAADLCAEPIGEKVAEGQSGIEVLREMLLVILQLFDLDANGKLSKSEREEAVTVIIKAIFS